MESHPNIHLMVHSTTELESILGEVIVSRTQMHAWPLSLVELLTTVSGSRFVYKVQREPTVEPEFFTQVNAHFLPPGQVLQRDAQQAAMLFPFLEGPTLRDQPIDERAWLEHGRALVRMIGEVNGDVPLYVDLGSLPAWRDFAGVTLGMLRALVESGEFQLVQPKDLDFLARWVERREVLDAIEQTSQVINGDLKSEHIFLAQPGYQIIDWQRPYRAPGDIDLVTLLESQQIDPRPYVQPAVFALRWFLFVHWGVEAKTHLLPHLPFFDQWARRGIDQILSSNSAIPGTGKVNLWFA